MQPLASRVPTPTNKPAVASKIPLTPKSVGTAWPKSFTPITPPEIMPTTNSSRHAKSRDLGINKPVKIPLMPAIFPFISNINVAEIPKSIPPINESQGIENVILSSTYLSTKHIL
ncbi:Uncharacterised protein [Vibrio cholerae]|uniref:Uncharacterized protein n=1 Tax=Vibrio cholerae TaxID=666 RepID=A0A655QHS6_VIBCL|nr:Uncharacterised protein [Vibrio cholerae]